MARLYDIHSPLPAHMDGFVREQFRRIKAVGYLSKPRFGHPPVT
jgi:hypothetical protein